MEFCGVFMVLEYTKNVSVINEVTNTNPPLILDVEAMNVQMTFVVCVKVLQTA